MPVRAKRVCNAIGCGNVTGNTGGYCDNCSQTGRDETANQRRHKQTDPFYYSTEWRRFRSWWLRGHPLCVFCGQPGEMVDHIVPIKAGGARLDPDNAQTSCNRCHNKKTGSERTARRILSR